MKRLVSRLRKAMHSNPWYAKSCTLCLNCENSKTYQYYQKVSLPPHKYTVHFHFYSTCFKTNKQKKNPTQKNNKKNQNKKTTKGGEKPQIKTNKTNQPIH